MAQLNAGIILGGMQPDIMGAFDRGQQTGARQNAIGQQNALAQLYQTQGAGIAAGDQNALNALAQIDPMASLGVQGQRQQMQARSQQMRMLDDQQRMQIEQQAAQMTAQQRAEEAARIEQGLSGAAFFHQSGDQAGYQRFLQERGLDPAQYPFEQFPAIAATFGEVLNVWKGFQPAAGDSAKEQEIARIMQDQGVDRRTAQGVADGVLRVSQDPTTREIMVTNLATGETYMPTLTQGPGQAQPMPQQTQQPPAQPAPQPQENPSFGDAFQGAQNSFGFQGVMRGIANTAADATGFDVPFPADQQTRQDFEVLGESLVNDFASAYGRQPPSWLLKNIAELVPQAGRPLEGPQRARTKLTSIARDMESRKRVAEASLRRRLTPAERQEAQALIAGIDATLARVQAALQGFEGGPAQGGNRTSSGVSWSVEE